MAKGDATGMMGNIANSMNQMPINSGLSGLGGPMQQNNSAQPMNTNQGPQLSRAMLDTNPNGMQQSTGVLGSLANGSMPQNNGLQNLLQMLRPQVQPQRMY